MPSTTNLGEAPRKALPIFYLLDTSGSMAGTPIGTLNSAMGETMEALKDLAKKNSDAILKIGVLQFNTNVKWMNAKGLEDAEDFFYEDLSAGGMTYMGAALKELDSKLSRHAFLDNAAGNLMPVIIVMSDGYANDDYKKELDKIRNNKWFKRATKIAFAIGDDADLKMLAEVVGDVEAVIRTSDMAVFADMIRFVSVTASMLVSTSSTTATAVSGGDIVGMAIKESQESGSSDVETAGGTGITIAGDPNGFDDPDDPDPWGGTWE